MSETNDGMMALADLAAQNENLKPLMDAIEAIMSIPDAALTPEMTKSFSEMLTTSFTPDMREQSIQEIIAGFKQEGISRIECHRRVKDMNSSFDDMIELLQPSDAKREVLNSMFRIFIDMFNEVGNRYLSYDIEMPIQLDEGAHMPTYAHETDAAADVYAIEDQVIGAHTLGNKVHTGVRFGTPEGWKLKLSPRSSIGAKTPLRLSNMIGLIDSDYRGELIILFDNNSDSDYTIHAGDRVAQIELEPVYRFKAIQVEKVDETERGEGGFGSTGK